MIASPTILSILSLSKDRYSSPGRFSFSQNKRVKIAAFGVHFLLLRPLYHFPKQATIVVHFRKYNSRGNALHKIRKTWSCKPTGCGLNRQVTDNMI